MRSGDYFLGPFLENKKTRWAKERGQLLVFEQQPRATFTVLNFFH
jgi:hypothetical protein